MIVLRKLLLVAVISTSLFLLSSCTQNVTNSALTIDVDGQSVSGSYTGVLENGVPSGEGTFTSDDKKYVYEGSWANGVPSGSGHLYYDGYTVHFSDVDRIGVYDGDVVDGVPKGNGTFSAENDSHVKYTHSGEFDGGIMNGQGVREFEADDYCTRTGNFTNGDFDPSKLEFIKSLGDKKDGDLIYSVSELAEKFITENEWMFPCNDATSLINFVDYNTGYKELDKAAEKHGDHLIYLKNAYVVQIDEVEQGLNKFQTVSYLVLEDENNNAYYVVFLGELPDIYSGDRVAMYGLPVAFSSYESIEKTTIKAPVVLASLIAK